MIGIPSSYSTTSVTLRPSRSFSSLLPSVPAPYPSVSLHVDRFLPSFGMSDLLFLSASMSPRQQGLSISLVHFLFPYSCISTYIHNLHTQ